MWFFISIDIQWQTREKASTQKKNVSRACLCRFISFEWKVKRRFEDFRTKICCDDKTIHSNCNICCHCEIDLFFSFSVSAIPSVPTDCERIYFNTSFQWSLLPFQWTTKSVVVLVADVLEIDSKWRQRCLRTHPIWSRSRRHHVNSSRKWQKNVTKRSRKKMNLRKTKKSSKKTCECFFSGCAAFK